MHVLEAVREHLNHGLFLLPRRKILRIASRHRPDFLLHPCPQGLRAYRATALKHARLETIQRRQKQLALRFLPCLPSCWCWLLRRWRHLPMFHEEMPRIATVSLSLLSLNRAVLCVPWPSGRLFPRSVSTCDDILYLIDPHVFCAEPISPKGCTLALSERWHFCVGPANLQVFVCVPACSKLIPRSSSERATV